MSGVNCLTGTLFIQVQFDGILLFWDLKQKTEGNKECSYWCMIIWHYSADYYSSAAESQVIENIFRSPYKIKIRGADGKHQQGAQERTLRDTTR